MTRSSGLANLLDLYVEIGEVGEVIDVETPRCIECGKSTVLTLPTRSVIEWQRGAYVQAAFPDMSPAEREQLITGTHPACWEAMFADTEGET